MTAHHRQNRLFAAVLNTSFEGLGPGPMGNLGHWLFTQTLLHSLCRVTRSSAHHCTMENLPGELLCLIARQVLEKDEGLRLWCKLASTCTRLWSFQMPAEPAYILDNMKKKHGISRCCHDNA